VLGDMAELGTGAAGYHREVGELLGELGIEVVVAVGPESRAYGGTWFATVAELREALGDVIESGDAVLVKASRSVGLEDVVEAIAP
jgi:UDP-N-acetylmuramoyl-tripeptide--D-alanyl-D-alanine ligase